MGTLSEIILCVCESFLTPHLLSPHLSLPVRGQGLRSIYPEGLINYLKLMSCCQVKLLDLMTAETVVIMMVFMDPDSSKLCGQS